jgi:hypothetical protein
MLRLAYDRKNRVLLVTISGIFASAELEALDRAVIGFAAREGRMRAIYDYTDVEAFAVPESRIVQRAQQPSIMHEPRVVVASRALGGAGARAFARHQRDAARREAVIVGTLEEAYAMLQLRNPQFETVER